MVVGEGKRVHLLLLHRSVLGFLSLLGGVGGGGRAGCGVLCVCVFWRFLWRWVFLGGGVMCAKKQERQLTSPWGGTKTHEALGMVLTFGGFCGGLGQGDFGHANPGEARCVLSWWAAKMMDWVIQIDNTLCSFSLCLNRCVRASWGNYLAETTCFLST